LTETVGACRIVTVTVFVSIGPLSGVYVAVYVVVVVGETVMLCVVAPPGAQLYVPPGIDAVAVRFTGCPVHIEVSGEIASVSLQFMTMVCVTEDPPQFTFHCTSRVYVPLARPVTVLVVSVELLS
jgi:hypothetical protein